MVTVPVRYASVIIVNEMKRDFFAWGVPAMKQIKIYFQMYHTDKNIDYEKILFMKIEITEISKVNWWWIGLPCTNKYFFSSIFDHQIFIILLHWNEFRLYGFIKYSNLSFVKPIRFIGTLKRVHGKYDKSKNEKHLRVQSSSLPSLCFDGPKILGFLARKIGQSRIWLAELFEALLDSYKLNSFQVQMLR